jgi:hypothetical protein
MILKYFADDQIKMGWACSTYRERKCALKVLVGKPRSNRSLGRPSHRYDKRIILKWIYRNWDGALETYLSGSE